MPGDAGVTVVTMLACFFIYMRGCGRPARLAFPVPSDFWGKGNLHNSDASRRGKAKVCLSPSRNGRSAPLTIFWHCGFSHFSFRTGTGTPFRQQTVNGFGRGYGSKGSGNADSQLYVRSSGWSGQCRPCLRDSGCVYAHPATRRAAASYRPLRAVWAVCAWALRGCARSPVPFGASAAHQLKEFS